MKKEEKIITDEEWKNKLTSAEYHILREKGTEGPFTGKYDEFFEDGRYRCAGCDVCDCTCGGGAALTCCCGGACCSGGKPTAKRRRSTCCGMEP